MTSPDDENAGDTQGFPAEDAMPDSNGIDGRRHPDDDLDAGAIIQFQHHENTRDPDKVTSS